MPARRSGWPPPRPLPASWRPCSCLPSIWPGAKDAFRAEQAGRTGSGPDRHRRGHRKGTAPLAAADQALVERYYDSRDFLFVGRGLNFPIALEGALKLKEISYIHAEGYAAGELKHGPIALIDKDMPVLALVPRDSVYQKTISNVEEIKARQGRLLLVGTRGDGHLSTLTEDVLYLPAVHEDLNPILYTIPAQLIAYEIANRRGCDVDQPRNLAKSVTVE